MPLMPPAEVAARAPSASTRRRDATPTERKPAACDLAHDPSRVAITRLTARTIAGASEEVKGLRGANGALKREVIDYNVRILTRPGGK
jgi:hypothetical protein